MSIRTQPDISGRSGRPAATMHVADLAARAGISPTTVRYYARIGLLSPDRDDHNGYRMFDREDFRRLLFIRRAQSVGLTIADIRSLLDRIDQGSPVCDRVVELVRRRLEEIAQRRRELDAAQERIEKALARWSDRPGKRSDFCPLIDQIELLEGSDESPVPGCVHGVGAVSTTRTGGGIGRESGS